MDPDERIMGELLKQLGNALNETPPNYERLRQILDVAPGRVVSFADEHREIALKFLEQFEIALDRAEARSLSERGRLQ